MLAATSGSDGRSVNGVIGWPVCDDCCGRGGRSLGSQSSSSSGGGEGSCVGAGGGGVGLYSGLYGGVGKMRGAGVALVPRRPAGRGLPEDPG